MQAGASHGTAACPELPPSRYPPSASTLQHLSCDWDRPAHQCLRGVARILGEGLASPHKPSFSQGRPVVNRPALASRYGVHDEDEDPRRPDEDGDSHRTEQCEFQFLVFQPGQATTFCWGYR